MTDNKKNIQKWAHLKAQKYENIQGNEPKWYRETIKKVCDNIEHRIVAEKYTSMIDEKEYREDETKWILIHY